MAVYFPPKHRDTPLLHGTENRRKPIKWQARINLQHTSRFVLANPKWIMHIVIRSQSRNYSGGSWKRKSLLLNSNFGMRRVFAQVLAVTDTSGASNRYDTHNLRKTNIQLSYCCTPLAPSAVNQSSENFRLEHKTTGLSQKCAILHYINIA
jgi:hypothetical protein